MEKVEEMDGIPVMVDIINKERRNPKSDSQNIYEENISKILKKIINRDGGNFRREYRRLYRKIHRIGKLKEYKQAVGYYNEKD